MNLLQSKLGRNDDIVEHQKLRQVEMELLEYREHLERRKRTDKRFKKEDVDIETLIDKERARLRER
jgi:hypothetical protein